MFRLSRIRTLSLLSTLALAVVATPLISAANASPAYANTPNAVLVNSYATAWDNITHQVLADGTLTGVKQTITGAISGQENPNPPLYGGGPFTGIVTGKSIQFTVISTQPNPANSIKIIVTGTISQTGSMSGKYTAVTTTENQKGTWTASIPPVPLVNCIVNGKSAPPGTQNSQVISQVYSQVANYREYMKVDGVVTAIAASPTVQLAAFEAALVESDFNNCSNGDADSVGVFQQRNTGWGTVAQRENVIHATDAFLSKAIKLSLAHPSWTSAVVAQKTQTSKFPLRYQQAASQALKLLNQAAPK